MGKAQKLFLVSHVFVIEDERFPYSLVTNMNVISVSDCLLGSCALEVELMIAKYRVINLLRG